MFTHDVFQIANFYLALPKGPCYPNPCQNKGVCSAVGSDYECDCPPDYNDGEDCTTCT